MTNLPITPATGPRRISKFLGASISIEVPTAAQDWEDVDTLNTDATGTGAITADNPNLTFPLYYQAVGN